jgi:2-oxoglutarate dehydrogenase E2 component (dihydrolipoamide succinyltransferase)
MREIPVVVPDLGEIVETVRLVRWLKRPGEKVAHDEDLLEVTTEKMDVVIQTPSAGMLLKTTATAGDRVKVGTQVGTILSSRKRRR